VNHQTAPVELHVDVFGDVYARQLEAHHCVLTVLDDLGGRGEAIGTVPVRYSLELESIPRKFQQRVRWQ
jgi:hypothetical protein